MQNQYTPAASSVPSPRWRERIEIARSEISAALVVVASARLNELLAQR